MFLLEGDDLNVIYSISKYIKLIPECLVDILESKSKKTIFESKWKRGTMNALYGYSGTRHAIGRVFKGQVLKEFKQIKK